MNRTAWMRKTDTFIPVTLDPQNTDDKRRFKKNNILYQFILSPTGIEPWEGTAKGNVSKILHQLNRVLLKITHISLEHIVQTHEHIWTRYSKRRLSVFPASVYPDPVIFQPRDPQGPLALIIIPLVIRSNQWMREHVNLNRFILKEIQVWKTGRINVNALVLPRFEGSIDWRVRY